MRVIGTAGHVDHGKSTLIQALTGTHPDRLKEEQEREMTIDLGFAWWTLPDGEEVGVVDVPGHRDFIENMLAGVGGIDAVLFVVAADEGVMPQTCEHLAIIDLLQIPAGVVVLTKTDMVQDPDWLRLVQEELRGVLVNTVLAKAPIVPVSARTGEGLDALQSALQETLAVQPHRPDLSRPRLPVDRAFTIAGFGTVVTGTLLDGAFRVSDEVELQPGGLKGRVRGLQSHKQQVELAEPGSRTAVNITGIDVDAIQRGQVLGHPGAFKSTRRLDVHFRHLPDSSQPLTHDMEVKFFVGAAERIARLRLLGVEALNPGEEGWLQLELREPVVAVRGDRYILRRPSPGETLGGGDVLDAHPKGRHRRFAADVLARLEALAAGSPADVLVQALNLGIAAPLSELAERASLEPAAAQAALQELLDKGEALIISGEQGSPSAMLAAAPAWNALQGGAIRDVERFHAEYPLRAGMPREELKSRLKLETAIFNALLNTLSASGKIMQNGPLVLKEGHTVSFDPAQQERIDLLLARFTAAPFATPGVKECIESVGEPVYQALLDLGRLQQLSPDVVLRPEDFQQAVADVRALIAEHGELTLAQARDHWNTSRKYVQPILETMDAQGITYRQGDARILK